METKHHALFLFDKTIGVDIKSLISINEISREAGDIAILVLIGLLLMIAYRTTRKRKGEV